MTEPCSRVRGDTFKILNGVGFIGHRPIENAEVISENDGRFKRRQIICRFDNGWSLSIIWGDRSYSDNHRTSSAPFAEEVHLAEIAAILPNGCLASIWEDSSSPIQGWLSTDRAWDAFLKIEAK